MERIKRALAAARRQRQQRPASSPVNSAPGYAGDSIGPAAADPVPSRPLRDARLWFGIVTAAIVVSMLAWIIAVQYQKRNLDLAAFEAATDMTGRPVSQSEESISTKQLRDDIASLQAHVALVDESVIRLYNKLTELHQRVDAIAAAGAVAAAENQAAEHVQQAASAPDTASQPVDREQGLSAALTPVVGTSDGPWVINLVSFPDEPAAERFAARARAKDIAAEHRQAMVNGKTYWRVQVPGFASAGAARSHATSIENRLGLKDTWVSRR